MLDVPVVSALSGQETGLKLSIMVYNIYYKYPPESGLCNEHSVANNICCQGVINHRAQAYIPL